MNIRSLHCLAVCFMVVSSLFGNDMRTVTFYNNTMYHVDVELSCGCPITGKYAQVALSVSAKSKQSTQVPSSYPLRSIKAFVVAGEYELNNKTDMQQLAQKSTAMGYSLKIDGTKNVKQIAAFTELRPANNSEGVFLINADPASHVGNVIQVKGLAMYRFIQ